jgi:hypothetical protein
MSSNAEGFWRIVVLNYKTSVCGEKIILTPHPHTTNSHQTYILYSISVVSVTDVC